MLKNSKRSSKVQELSCTVPEKPKSWTELACSFGTLTSILLQSIKQSEGGPFGDIGKFSEKSLKAETRHKCTRGRGLLSLVKKILRKFKKVL